MDDNPFGPDPGEPSAEWWGRVMAYEQGTLYVDDAKIWFQELIISGNIWRLPDKYLEQASYFIKKGMITFPTKESNAL